MIYVLQVKPQKEHYVHHELNKHSELKVFIPTEVRLERHKGVWVEKEVLLFPSYVFIECDFNSQIYYKIKSVSGVSKLLGYGSPAPLSIIETERITWLFNNGKAITPSTGYIDNNRLYITSGVLKGKEHLITKVSKRQKRVIITTTLNGEKKEYTLSVNIPQ